MPARPLEEHKTEVDMVPYIDIVSLLLLFLVITGDMTKSATGVKMKLPRADQAATEKKLGISTEGRIVVQMKPKDVKNVDAGYFAVVENNQYDLVAGNQSLVNYLKEQVDRRVAKGLSKLGESGEVSFPVKLRIPTEAPMYQVERVVMICAKAGLVNVHYAADNKDKKE
jgi:biopolymer transport protein ExbD